jgi:hypothetical protein
VGRLRDKPVYKPVDGFVERFVHSPCTAGAVSATDIANRPEACKWMIGKDLLRYPHHPQALLQQQQFF